MKYCDTCHSAYPDDFAVCPRDQGPLRYASDLRPGMVLRGKYEVLEKIGSGGMASVYRVRHQAFGEIFALKVVGPKLSHDETFLKRFRTEAVVTRRLQHPHAVRVEDLDTTEDGRPFIVMEFVEGPNLRELIRREAPLAPARAVEITRQAASALAAAHALGIVHRDIKPDNILMARGSTGGDHAKVLDFGIAKVKEGVLEGEAYTPTRTGMVVGTPQYVSPEQAMGKRGEEIDGRSDLYSLGVVLYEMLTGRLPFASDTAMGMILHHLQTAPTPPHLARPDLDIPAPLSDVLMRALQKEAAERFPSALDMVAALDAVAAGLPSTPPPGPVEIARGGAAPLALPRPTPQPATPSPRPTPQPAPTRVDDITERPTRVFDGAATPVSPTAVVPAAAEAAARRRDTVVWIVTALVCAFFFLWRGHVEDQERAAAGAAAAETEAPAGDEELAESVQELLATARLTREEEEIEVDVDEGVVTLSGKVRQPAAAAVAEALAGSVPGVKEVRSRLEAGARVPGGSVQVPPTPPPGFHPDVPVPPFVRFRHRPSPGTVEHQALQEMLREGRQALERGEPQAAMTVFGGALALDPRNEEARKGMQDATRQLRKVKLKPPRPEPPAASPPGGQP